MLPLFLAHVLVEHQENESVLLQTKITFETECFVAQLKYSNVSVGV